MSQTMIAVREGGHASLERVAVPAREGDNPWKRKGDQWRPKAAAA